MKRRLLSSVVWPAAVLVACGALARAQGNPMVGTWRLDAAHSTFSAGAGPKSQTRTWSADGTVKVTSIMAAGETATYSYTIKPDGKPYPATGAVPNGADSVTSTRVDARTIRSQFSRNGKPADVTTFTVSADGKRLTLVAQGIQANGQPLSDHLVYERQ